MVYITDVSPLRDKATFDKYFLACHEYRKNKIQNLSHEDDRIRSLGAEILIAYGMLDNEISDYHISVSGAGKLYDANSGACFNVSHSGVYAVSVFDECEVGIDIEIPRNVDLKLAERFFSPEEKAVIVANPSPEKDLLRIWTRKEALFKAYGIGITANLLATNVLSDTVVVDGISFGISTKETDYYIISVARKGVPTLIICENIIIT